MKRKKQGISIKNIMVRISIVTWILFALLLIGVLVSVRGIITDITEQYTSMTSQKLESQLEVMYEKMNVYAMNISREECVRELLTDSEAHIMNHLNDVKELLVYFRILEPAITDIALVNDHIHYSSIYMKEELDELAHKNESKSFTWLETRYSSFLSHKNDSAQLIYSLPVNSNGMVIGTVLISLDSSTFQIDEKDIGQAIYMLADRNGIIYAFNGRTEQAEQIWRAWKKLDYATGEEDNYIIQSVYSESMRCWQVSALDRSQVSAHMRYATGMIYGCVCFSAFFLLSIIFVMQRQVIYPLRRFQRRIQDMSGERNTGKTEYTIQGIGGCEEIEKIREEFNFLMEEQKQLNHRIFNTAADLYEIKIQKQQAELSYLRSQIDPHFLYNTLEVIRKMACLREAPEIAEMAVDMGKIFRYSTKGEEYVPLCDELEMIKAYIHIQQMRFGGKICVFYSIEDEVTETKIVKMLMQPIVENAIVHGLEPKESEGNLFIAARKEADTLVITIKDDGIGITEKELADIQEALKQEVFDTSVHVGILNTQARIRLQYGQKYGLQIESKQGDGTTVTIYVPIGKVRDGNV